MSSNLKVNTILPSTGTTIGIGTVGGLINVVGNIDVNSTSGISTFNGLEISGIVTAKAGAAVTYYGDGSNLTGITGTTINNNANNRVITGSGTANTLEGESTLTFNGTDLEIQPASAAPALFIGDSNRTGAGQGLVHFRGNWNGTTVARITIDTGDDTTNKDDGIIRFDTSSTGSLVERVRIDSSGQLGIGANNNSSYDSNARNVLIASSGNTGITIRSGGSSNYAMIHFADGTSGSAEQRAGRILYEHSTDSLQFSTANTYRFKIDGSGRVLIGTTTEGHAAADDLTIATSGSTGITIRSGTSSEGNIFFSDATSGDAEYAGFITYDHSTNNMRFTTNATERFRFTSGGQVVQYTNHTSGTSAHQNTGWYGDDANNYTLEYKDFNEIRAVKTVNTSDYNSIVYKREMMTEYCDIEFTLKGSSSNSQRHVGFIINGDGSDTSSNFDRLVFRSVPGTTSSNQIRLDKGAGGQGFSETSSNIPTFFDGNERHIHIQIRKRTFSITVNRLGHSEYNFNARTSADLVSPRGYFGFSIYEPSSASPEVTIRDFKITNYTQNAIPSTSVAFQATHSGNPGKSGGSVVKPCNVEQYDYGYGGNFNTSNYRFTAPVAGMYQFANTFNCYSSPSNMYAAIRVNGSTLYVGQKRNNNTGNGDQNVTAYCITQLQPGDYVEAIDNTSNSVTYSSGITWNRFEGSLIAAFK